VTLAGTPVEKHEESLRVAHKDAGRRFAAKSSIVSTRRRASSKTRSTLTSFIRAQLSRTLGITSGNPFWLEGRTYPVRCNCVLSRKYRVLDTAGMPVHRHQRTDSGAYNQTRSH